MTDGWTPGPDSPRHGDAAPDDLTGDPDLPYRYGDRSGPPAGDLASRSRGNPQAWPDDTPGASDAREPGGTHRAGDALGSGEARGAGPGDQRGTSQLSHWQPGYEPLGYRRTGDRPGSDRPPGYVPGQPRGYPPPGYQQEPYRPPAGQDRATREYRPSDRPGGGFSRPQDYRPAPAEPTVERAEAQTGEYARYRPPGHPGAAGSASHWQPGYEPPGDLAPRPAQPGREPSGAWPAYQPPGRGPSRGVWPGYEPQAQPGGDYQTAGPSAYMPPAHDPEYAGPADQQPAYQPPYQRPDLETPYQRPNYEAPYRGPDHEAPYQRPEYEAPYHRPDHETPYHRPDHEALYQRPDDEAPYRRPDYAEPYQSQLGQSRLGQSRLGQPDPAQADPDQPEFALYGPPEPELGGPAAPEPPELAVPYAGHPPRRARRGRRRHGLWLGVGAALVIVVAAAAFLTGKLGSAPTAQLPPPPAHRLVTPQTIGTYTRDKQAEQQLGLSHGEQYVTQIDPGHVSGIVAAAYDTGGPASSPNSVAVIAGRLVNSPLADVIKSFTQQETAEGNAPVAVPAGSFGGRAACAGKGNSGICVWADADTVGILVSATVKASSLAQVMLTIRSGVEVPAA